MTGAREFFWLWVFRLSPGFNKCAFGRWMRAHKRRSE